MGRSRYYVGDNKAPHFVTCTVLNWMPLFTRPQRVEIILEALQYRQKQAGWKIYGYVILENHLHLGACPRIENLLRKNPFWPAFPKIFVKERNCSPQIFEKPDSKGLSLATASILGQAPSGSVRKFIRRVPSI